MKFKTGDTVYLVENNLRVSDATVMNASSRLCTIRLAGCPGAIRVRESRLFAEKEEALATLPKPEKPVVKAKAYYED